MMIPLQGALSPHDMPAYVDKWPNRIGDALFPVRLSRYGTLMKADIAPCVMGGERAHILDAFDL
jgi:hypothetical protein